MRWWVCGLLIATACPALAADYDDSWLRGSQVIGTAPVPPPRLYRIWAGVYGGGQVGEDFHGVDFRSVPAPAIASAIQQDAILTGLGAALPGMPALPSLQYQGPQLWRLPRLQLADRRRGVRRSSSTPTGPRSMRAQPTSVTRSYIVVNGGSTYAPTTVNVTSTATADMSTYGTVRGRLGWAMGKLSALPRRRRFVRADRHYAFVDVNYFGIVRHASIRQLRIAA